MPSGGMYDFAAVSPPGSSVVLTFGGVDSATGRHRDGIDLYDSRVRRWMPSPSGARALRGGARPRPTVTVCLFVCGRMDRRHEACTGACTQACVAAAAS
jgi:hypothetical protein